MSGWPWVNRNSPQEYVGGTVEDSEYEATEEETLTDILTVLESIESHMERLGNAIEQGNQEAAEFYAEFFKRLTASK